jgi:hypothetical protein
MPYTAGEAHGSPWPKHWAEKAMVIPDTAPQLAQ